MPLRQPDLPRVTAETPGIAVLDSITSASNRNRDQVIICGSHGGEYAAHLAALVGVRGVVFNDAGLGKDAAGIAGLALLQALGIPAVAVAHTSARIGDGADIQKRGLISHMNAAAASLGCRVGEPARTGAHRLIAAPRFVGAVTPRGESRHVLFREASGRSIIGLDSAALVTPADAGHVLVVGSHGGLRGNRPEAALRTEASAAVFHDAGLGVDRAGIGRLEVLNERGIAAATVAGETARIGDCRSVYETGVISYVNTVAAQCGATVGQSARQFSLLMLALPSGPSDQELSDKDE